MHHDWHVKKAIVEGNSEHAFSSNSLSSLGGQQDKDIRAALQMLLTGVRLHVQCRLYMY